ncbi:hypothetical protein [uncultured Fibrella sp.]|uniref:hypothetical protein n=1 Tax=uncultured Fibrella sp. TaxID=1284596 RepID=UPI0035CC6751
MNVPSFIAYLNQRFPLVNMGLFAVLFLTVYSVAERTWPVTASGTFGWHEGGPAFGFGMVAVISFFFRLRVFDEQKDYALDSINHPDRVLQSGRVTLPQLQRVAIAGACLEITWSALMGLSTVVCWLLAVGYSLLMRYEFFISDFLKKRLVLYAVTHMFIMPLIIWWVWSAYAPAYGAANALYLLAALSLLGGFAFEIARKVHVPEAERDLIDSYSKSMGYQAAIVTVLLVLLISVLVQCYLLRTLNASLIPFILIGLLYLATLAIYLLSLSRPREKTLKLAELLVSLSMLVSYLSIILVVHF